jgi:hypothetical protein
MNEVIDIGKARRSRAWRLLRRRLETQRKIDGYRTSPVRFIEECASIELHEWQRLALERVVNLKAR